MNLKRIAFKKSAIMLLLFFASLILTSHYAMAEVKMPRIFSNNMVLQREVPIKVWGKADTGERVFVSMQGEVRSDIDSFVIPHEFDPPFLQPNYR